MQRMLVTGSREWKDYGTIYDVMSEYGPHQLIHGGARGADSHAHHIAMELGWPEPIVVRPRYDLYPSNKAPLIRNVEMVEMLEPGDVVLAFPIHKRSGTWNCIKAAQMHGFDVRVYKDNGWLCESG